MVGWDGTKCLTTEIMREGGRCDRRHWEGEGLLPGWWCPCPVGLEWGPRQPAPLSVYILFPVRASPLPHVWRRESKTQGPRDLKRKPVSPPKVYAPKVYASNMFWGTLSATVSHSHFLVLVVVHFSNSFSSGREKSWTIVYFSISFKLKSFRILVSELKSFCLVKKRNLILIPV